MLSGLATFLPILSFTVPWSGEILIYLSLDNINSIKLK